MKKVVAILIVLCMMYTVVLAETDLSAMSFDELVSLSRKVSAEIMSRPEWKEVEVPVGVWTVGVDIPAGVYSVRPARSSANFACYDENGRLQLNLLCLDGESIGKVELLDGWTVKPSSPVIFAPPLSLGF